MFMDDISVEERTILKFRLLYTGLIKNVLIAWRLGCPVANPGIDIRYLAKNPEMIIGSIESYFRGCLHSDNDNFGEKDNVKHSDTNQIKRIIQAVSRIHEAVIDNKAECASEMAGSNEIETMEKMIRYYENYRKN